MFCIFMFVFVRQVCSGRRSPASAGDGSAGGRHRAHTAHHYGDRNTDTQLSLMTHHGNHTF